MYILFDIGGTKMRIALSRDGETFEEPTIVETPKDFEEGIAMFKNTCKGLCGEEKILGAAGGIAGPLNKEKTMLISSPNLPSWVGKELVSELSSTIDAPVYLNNDTAIVGLGEAVAGAGKGHEIVVYMTVSTGVGGARIVSGRIDPSSMGFEPGHQIIDADASLCPDCPKKDLEGYISGKNIEKRFGKKPYEILDNDFWDKEAELLAYGLNNTIVHWSPDIVVIGGSMMKKIGIPIEAIRKHLKNILTIFPEHPVIEKSTLGDIGGLHGALAYLKQNLP